MDTLSHFSRRVSKGLAAYAANLAAFSANARLYLVNAVIFGAALGVFRLLFNFYVLSLGYDETLVGNLTTASSLTALIAALPMGYLADLIGRKRSLVLGGSAIVTAILVMVIFPNAGVFIAMNVLIGLGQSISGVTMGPFLMENSSEQERVYLFSFSSGLSTASSFIGNWVGGRMPTWLGSAQNVSATSTQAYGSSLLVVAVCAGLGVIPLILMRMPNISRSQRSVFAPIAFFKSEPALVGKLILPMLITSLGAGLIMPFMNVFFRTVHHQSDSAIGLMFALGSLAMAVGLILAPPLADRVGKIQLVVISQALSIPFLYILGFSSWFPLVTAAYYIRVGLMNMSGPVYQTYVLEKVKPEARATIASLISMANSFGWALSPTISGMLQVRYGFGPSFTGTIVLYCLSTFLYWWYFWKAFKPKSQAEQLPG
jgi:MFS family permease